MTTNTTRSCYLSTAELHRLDLACAELARFAREDDGYGGVYLVGSAGARPDFRDVDVRLILMDDTFDALFGHSPMLWGIFCYAVSRQLAADTGLPIDFQVQRCTQANDAYKPADGHHRNLLGHHQRDFADRGDATLFVETTGRYKGSIADLSGLAGILRNARRRKGVSLRKAAREIGCSFSTISRAETGQDINLNNALAILKWVNE